MKEEKEEKYYKIRRIRLLSLSLATNRKAKRAGRKDGKYNENFKKTVIIITLP